MTIMNHTASITTPEVAPALDLKSYKNTVTCCCVRETERSDSRLTQRVLTVLLSFQSIPASHSPPPPSSSHSFSTSLIQELANFLSLFFHFAVLCVYPSHGYVSVFLCESLFIILCPDLALS